MQGLPPIALRGMRVEQAVALQEPDRVPFIPTWNNFYQLEYGVSITDGCLGWAGTERLLLDAAERLRG